MFLLSQKVSCAFLSLTKAGSASFVICFLFIISTVYASDIYDITPPGTDEIIDGFGDYKPIHSISNGAHVLDMNTATYYVVPNKDSIACWQKVGMLRENLAITFAGSDTLLRNIEYIDSTEGFAILKNNNIRIAFHSDGTIWVHVLKAGTDIKFQSKISKSYDKGGDKFEVDTVTMTDSSHIYPDASRRIIKTNWMVITDDGCTDDIASTGGFGVYCRPSYGHWTASSNQDTSEFGHYPNMERIASSDSNIVIMHSSYVKSIDTIRVETKFIVSIFPTKNRDDVLNYTRLGIIQPSFPKLFGYVNDSARVLRQGFYGFPTDSEVRAWTDTNWYPYNDVDKADGFHFYSPIGNIPVPLNALVIFESAWENSRDSNTTAADYMTGYMHTGYMHYKTPNSNIPGIAAESEDSLKDFLSRMDASKFRNIDIYMYISAFDLFNKLPALDPPYTACVLRKHSMTEQAYHDTLLAEVDRILTNFKINGHDRINGFYIDCGVLEGNWDNAGSLYKWNSDIEPTVLTYRIMRDIKRAHPGIKVIFHSSENPIGPVRIWSKFGDSTDSYNSDNIRWNPIGLVQCDIYAPFIDRYADIMVRGEGYPINIEYTGSPSQLKDYVSPHIKYVVNPIGKSNCAGTLIWTHTLGTLVNDPSMGYERSYYSDRYPISIGNSRTKYSFITNEEIDGPDSVAEYRRINKLLVMNTIYDNYIKENYLLLMHSFLDQYSIGGANWYDRRLRYSFIGPGEDVGTPEDNLAYQHPSDQWFGPNHDYFRPVSLAWAPNYQDYFCPGNYRTSFENGLDKYWTRMHSNNSGRISIIDTNSPHTGNWHMVMDDTDSAPPDTSTNEAWLRLDLSGRTNAILSFWWKEFQDENDAVDGIYISDNGGHTAVKILSLQNGANNTWYQITIDLVEAADTNDLELTKNFVVIFKQRDNSQIPTDGFAFDDIALTIDTPLKLNYAFSDSVGSMAGCSVPGYEGTIYNATWQSKGVLKGSLQFNGIDDYVDFTQQGFADELFNNTANFTLLAWIHPDSFPQSSDSTINGGVILGQRSGESMVFGVNKDGHLFLSMDDATAADTTTLKKKIWYHVAVTYNQSTHTAQFYVFGSQATSGIAFDGNGIAAEDTLYIGKQGTTTGTRPGYFSGTIDELKIYAKALSDSEVLAEFNLFDDNMQPNSPTDFTAPAYDQVVKLRWSKSTSADVNFYRIYRQTGSSSFSPLDICSETSEFIAFDDTTVTNNTTYSYYITAVDYGGNESDPSNPQDNIYPQVYTANILLSAKAETLDFSKQTCQVIARGIPSSGSIIKDKSDVVNWLSSDTSILKTPTNGVLVKGNSCGTVLIYCTWMNERPESIYSDTCIVIIKNSGTIPRDTTWDQNITLTGDVTIPESVSLRIQGAVVVKCSSNFDDTRGGLDTTQCEIITRGKLVTEVESGFGPAFTSTGQTTGDWYGIRLVDSASTCSLHTTGIFYAQYGIRADSSLDVNYFDGGAAIRYCNTGIYGRNSKITIYGNVTDCAGKGIHLNNCTGRIGNVNYSHFPQIARNFNIGIQLERCRMLVDHAQVFDNEGNGIYLDQSLGDTVVGSSIWNNGNGLGCGIIAVGTSNALISGNNIHANHDYGIRCSGASPSIRFNTIYKNYHGGIVASGGSTPGIINNTLVGNSDNSDNGIYLGSSPTTIIGNIIAFFNRGIFSLSDSVLYFPEKHHNTLLNTTDFVNVSVNDDVRADPLFVDKASNNYKLRAVSPCIDAGFDDDSTDFNGTQDWQTGRFWNNGPDQGANEFAYSGTLDTNLTWQGRVDIIGDVTVPEGRTLQIGAGTQVVFAAGHDEMQAGSYTGKSELIAKGVVKTVRADSTDTALVTFTSSNSSPQPGDWGTVQIDTARTCNLDGALFEYGTDAVSIKGAYGPPPGYHTIKNAQFRHLAGNGITIDGGLALIGPCRFEESVMGTSVQGLQGSVVDVKNSFFGNNGANPAVILNHASGYIRGCHFIGKNNQGTGIQFLGDGVGIGADVYENTFDSLLVGVSVNDFTCEVRRNLFVYNQVGIQAFFDYPRDLYIYNNTFDGKFREQSYGVVVRRAAPYISNNIFYNLGRGIYEHLSEVSTTKVFNNAFYNRPSAVPTKTDSLFYITYNGDTLTCEDSLSKSGKVGMGNLAVHNWVTQPIFVDTFSYGLQSNSLLKNAGTQDLNANGSIGYYTIAGNSALYEKTPFMLYVRTDDSISNIGKVEECGSIVLSPIDITVVDPIGNFISRSANTIGTSAYYRETRRTDYDWDSVKIEKDIAIRINPMLNGTYAFKITRDSTATDADRYGFSWIFNGRKKVLADNVLVPAINDTHVYYYVVDKTAPGQLTGLVGIRTDNAISLSWTGNTESDLMCYNVYRDTISGFTAGSRSFLAQGERGTTSHHDYTINPNVQYYYRVAAVDSSGNGGLDLACYSTVPVQIDSALYYSCGTTTVGDDSIVVYFDQAIDDSRSPTAACSAFSILGLGSLKNASIRTGSTVDDNILVVDFTGTDTVLSHDRTRLVLLDSALYSVCGGTSVRDTAVVVTHNVYNMTTDVGYQTILAAYNADATPTVLDTIKVFDAGLYTDTLHLSKKMVLAVADTSNRPVIGYGGQGITFTIPVSGNYAKTLVYIDAADTMTFDGFAVDGNGLADTSAVIMEAANGRHTIRNCKVYNGCRFGILTAEGTNHPLLIEHNDVYSIVNIGIDPQNKDSAVVRYNRIHDISDMRTNGFAEGINAQDLRGCRFEGNIIYNISTTGNNAYGFALGNSRNQFIRNNVVYGTNYGIGMMTTSSVKCTSITIENNTVYGTGTALMLDDKYHTVRNNIFWGSSSNDINTWGPGGYTSNSTLSYNCFQTVNAAKVDTAGIKYTTQNPLFVNVGANDFHLQTGSPCINFSNFNADSAQHYGVNSDIEGLARPMPIGSEMDLGAFEEQTIFPIEWWNTSWTKRKALAFKNGYLTAQQDSFTMLVKLFGSRIDYGQTQNSGQDLRFTDADGVTALSYEIENWNEGGTSYVWVRVPRINASGSSDSIWMYYGNSSAADGQNPTGTWNSDYLAVWHFNSSDLEDHTANNNDLTNGGTTNNSSGLAGGCRQFTSANSQYLKRDYAIIGNNAQFTLGLWFKTTQTGITKLYDEYNSGSSGWMPAIELERHFSSSLDTSRFGVGDGSVFGGPKDKSATNTHNDAWHYICGVQDGKSKHRLFLDGARKDTTTLGTALGTLTLNRTTLGRVMWGSGGFGQFYNGLMDEVQICKVAQTDKWIETQDSSMRDHLLTYGSEQSNQLAKSAPQPQQPLAKLTVPGEQKLIKKVQPNPFKLTAEISYRVIGIDNFMVPVQVAVFDIYGNLVRKLVDEPQVSGEYSAIWDGRNNTGKMVENGVYYAEIRAGEKREMVRMMVVR